MGEDREPSPLVKRSQVINKWLVLLVASVGVLMVTVDGGIVSVSYPALVSSFRSDASTVAWVQVALFLVTASTLLTMGWVGDVLGRRKIFTMGFLVFTLGIALGALSQTIIQLIMARVVQAVGASMILSNTHAMVTAAFLTEERGKAIGILVAVVGLGAGIGPLIGGVLLDALDWRALFYTRLPIGLLGAGLTWFALPKDIRDKRKLNIDYLGAIALLGTLAAFLLMVNQGGRLGFSSPLVIAMGGLALVLFPVLILVERKASRPIFELSLFKDHTYARGLSVLMIHYMAQGSIMFLTPFYFINSLGYSAPKMGLFLTAHPLMRLFVSPLSGWLSDKVGYRLPVSLGLMLVAGGMFMFSRQGVVAPEWALVLSLVIAGVGTALFDAPTISSIMGSVTSDRLGMAAASVATARTIAQSIGIALAGAIFTIREKVYMDHLSVQGLSQAATEAQTTASAFSDTLGASVILALIGTAFAFMMSSKRPSNK